MAEITPLHKVYVKKFLYCKHFFHINVHISGKEYYVNAAFICVTHI